MQRQTEVLYQSKQVTLDASGNGELRFGPSKRGETWNIQRMVTSGTSASEPDVNVFRNGTTLSVRVDFTPLGNDDISETTTELRLQDNEFIVVQYTGGTNGAKLDYRIEGLIEWRSFGGGYNAV